MRSFMIVGLRRVFDESRGPVLRHFLKGQLYIYIYYEVNIYKY